MGERPPLPQPELQVTATHTVNQGVSEEIVLTAPALHLIMNNGIVQRPTVVACTTRPL